MWGRPLAFAAAWQGWASLVLARKTCRAGACCEWGLALSPAVQWHICLQVGPSSAMPDVGPLACMLRLSRQGTRGANSNTSPGTAMVASRTRLGDTAVACGGRVVAPPALRRLEVAVLARCSQRAAAQRLSRHCGRRKGGAGLQFVGACCWPPARLRAADAPIGPAWPFGVRTRSFEGLRVCCVMLLAMAAPRQLEGLRGGGADDVSRRKRSSMSGPATTGQQCAAYTFRVVSATCISAPPDDSHGISPAGRPAARAGRAGSAVRFPAD